MIDTKITHACQIATVQISSNKLYIQYEIKHDITRRSI